MLAVNQENEQLMEDYEKLASDVGTPGFSWPGPARPCHPVLRDQAAPRTHAFLQIHPWAQSQTGHCPSSQQMTKGGLGSPRNRGLGWVRGQSGLWRAEFQAFSITSLLLFFFFT